MEFKGLFASTILVAVVVLGIFSFATILQGNYSVSEPLVNNSKVQYLNDLRNNVTTIYGNANSSNTAFNSESPQVDTGGLMLTSIVGSGKLLVGSITLIYDVVVKGTAQSLGIDPAIMLLFESMLIGGLILALWSLYRLGR